MLEYLRCPNLQTISRMKMNLSKKFNDWSGSNLITVCPPARRVMKVDPMIALRWE